VAADDPTGVDAFDEPTGPPSPRRLRTFDSLIDVPAFRWYLLSMTGNWSALQMQQVARGFLAYQLTDSFVALGVVELGNSLPRVVLALFGGVVADRASRRVTVQVGQAINAALAIGLGAMLFLGVLRFEHLVISAVIQGSVNSFALPARQAMIPEIVGPARVMNAFALNVFALNVMRLVAPALAGVIIAAAGAGWVFVVMGVLNVLAVVAMFPVPATTAASRALAAGGAPAGPTAGHGGRASRAGLSDIADAFRYLRAERLLIVLLGLQGLTSMLALPYQRLLPGFVDEVLSTSPEQTAVLMGLLLTFTAVGALIGSLLIASLPNRARGQLLIGSLVLFGIALAAFAASSWLWVSAATVLVLGIGQAGRQSLVSILIQTTVSDTYRGRITSIQLLEDGVESLGIFGIAVLAEVVGPQIALGAVAASLVVLGLALLGTRTIRTLQ
jgi:MFS family permease